MMNLKTAIECAREESTAFKISVKVVKSPEGSYFPCRREWLDQAGKEYRLVAEALPNGKVRHVRK
jgi:hypothetical protein